MNILASKTALGGLTLGHMYSNMHKRNKVNCWKLVKHVKLQYKYYMKVVKTEIIGMMNIRLNPKYS